MILKEEIERVYDVGLTSFEHVCGNVPVLHDKLVWDTELVENHVEHIDIVSGRLSFNVDELEGTEVPVAGYNQRMLLCIAKVVGSREEGQKGQ